MQIRSSLTDLVLPLESRHNVSSTVLQRLETSVSEADTLTEAQWAEAAGAATQVPRKLLKLVYQLCADFSNRKDNISSSLLVFTLFLQNVSSTRKRRLSEKKKHAVEELLLQFIKDRYDTLTFIFKHQERLDTVLRIIFLDYNPAVPLDVEKMTHDSHGVVSCIKNGKKLVWKLGNPHTSGLAQMATTAHLSGAGDRKKIVLSQLIRQTLVKSSGSVRGSSVLVHRGNQSQLYLAAILRSLDVSKCRGCVVVAGPVRNTLRVSGCRGVTVVAAARRVVVEQSSDTTLYLLTPAPPLVAASCNNITIGCNGNLTPAEMNSYIIIDQSNDKSSAGNSQESSGAPKPDEKTVSIADGSNEGHEFVSQMVDQVVHQGLIDVSRPPDSNSTPVHHYK